jgi:hypothetical protein
MEFPKTVYEFVNKQGCAGRQNGIKPLQHYDTFQQKGQLPQLYVKCHSNTIIADAIMFAMVVLLQHAYHSAFFIFPRCCGIITALCEMSFQYDNCQCHVCQG